jgi:hypothetical protein
VVLKYSITASGVHCFGSCASFSFVVLGDREPDAFCLSGDRERDRERDAFRLVAGDRERYAFRLVAGDRERDCFGSLSMTRGVFKKSKIRGGWRRERRPERGWREDNIEGVERKKKTSAPTSASR